MENSNGKGTILLVDDEDVVLDVCTMMLEKLGFNVLAVSNGLDAVQIYRDRKENISLIIIDILMPKVSGSETCRRIKEINPKAKILHTSGLDAGQYRELPVSQVVVLQHGTTRFFQLCFFAFFFQSCL